MRTLGRRRKWTIAVAFMFIACEALLIRATSMKALFAGVFVGAALTTYAYIRLGVKHLKSVRTGGDPEWPDRTARQISGLAFGIVVAWAPFVLSRSREVDHTLNELMLNSTSVSIGMMFGAMVGCGGILGLRDDNTRDVPPNDSATGR